MYIKTDQRSENKSLTQEISPFEFKNKLISLAKRCDKKSTRAMLDAGRGNPNWIAVTPRESFFLLGQFAVQESRRLWDEVDIAGQPALEGITKRFDDFIRKNKDVPGVQLLKNIVDYGIQVKKFDADEWVHELVDGIIGDNYPMPDRMLIHVEEVVHDFLLSELYEDSLTHDNGDITATEKFDLFAVEGATAAMCYIFDSLLENYLLSQGDKIAIMVPIFPPYLEIPHLARYNFSIVEIKATATDVEGKRTWQYPQSELDKLFDQSIKALFVVNPSNPPSVAIKPDSIRQLVDIVKNNNPNLMIISDDVYGTFVEEFNSLMKELPFNTIGVYSFSKYFGVTGWRLGTIAVNKINVFDKLIKQLPEEKLEILRNRYSSLTTEPQKLKFIDRIVADSRQVALNHTAGLSTPQQVQMALFSVFALLDKNNTYRQRTRKICLHRMKLLYKSLGLPLPDLPYDADYYTEFDLEEWSGYYYGSEFTEYLKKNYDPLDILYRLAENSSIVLLNGGGFHGPTWSIRVSLANLDNDAYTRIGHELHTTLEQYVKEWKSSKPVAES